MDVALRLAAVTLDFSLDSLPVVGAMTVRPRFNTCISFVGRPKNMNIYTMSNAALQKYSRLCFPELITEVCAIVVSFTHSVRYSATELITTISQYQSLDGASSILNNPYKVVQTTPSKLEYITIATLYRLQLLLLASW